MKMVLRPVMRAQPPIDGMIAGLAGDVRSLLDAAHGTASR